MTVLTAHEATYLRSFQICENYNESNTPGLLPSLAKEFKFKILSSAD